MRVQHYLKSSNETLPSKISLLMYFSQQNIVKRLTKDIPVFPITTTTTTTTITTTTTTTTTTITTTTTTTTTIRNQRLTVITIAKMATTKQDGER